MWTVIQGDARRIPLGDETVQCVVTSPPFWGLRDYGIGDDAIGLEPTPELYAGLTAALPGNPTLYIARDLDLTTGNHGNLSVSHSVPAGSASVSATGLLEYNDGYYREESSFAFAAVDISVAVPLGALTLSPMVTVLGALHDDFKDYEDNPAGDTIRWVGGINLHLDF